MRTDIEETKVNVVPLLIIIFLIYVGTIALIAREYRIKKASDYDIKYEHFKMREQQEYLYCPYCGEYLEDKE